MALLNYILKKLLYGLIVLLGVITLIFFLFNILPGDPAKMVMGQRSDISSVEAIKKDLGLDKPLIVQYFNYLNDLSFISIHNYKNPQSYWYLDNEKYAPYIRLLNLGKEKTVVLKLPYLRRSFQSKKKVSSILLEALPNTAILATVSIFFAFVLGGWIGIQSAIHKGSFIDKISLIIAVAGMSLPSFFMAILISWIFAYLLTDVTGLKMYGSLYEIDDLGRGEYISLKNLILPAFTLGIRPLAIIIQLMRNSMLEVLSQDYIKTAKAKGLNDRKIIYRHALKNALNPVITAASGWFASLMAGAVFVEYIFDWKGIGVVIVNSLEKYDLPVIMGAVMLVSIFLVLINIIVDIVYGILDPRVRIT